MSEDRVSEVSKGHWGPLVEGPVSHRKDRHFSWRKTESQPDLEQQWPDHPDFSVRSRLQGRLTGLKRRAATISSRDMWRPGPAAGSGGRDKRWDLGSSWKVGATRIPRGNGCSRERFEMEARGQALS